MFNGIVETIGLVKYIEMLNDSIQLTILPQKKLSDIKIGDSISVNGACLTVTQLLHDLFTVLVVPETMRVTNLNKLRMSSQVNLERSLQLSDRMSGHYVQGHVDGIGKITSLQADGQHAYLVKISIPEGLANYIVNKGYIALDGMSITVIEASDEWFTVTFIPHTQQITIVQRYQPGTEINIEVDIFAKYVEKQQFAKLFEVRS